MIADTLFCSADSGAFWIAKPLLFCYHTPMPPNLPTFHMLAIVTAGTPAFLIALHLGLGSAGWLG